MQVAKQVVGKVGDFPPRTVKSLVIQDKPIMILNIDGSLRAMDGVCSHARGTFEEVLEGNVVRCSKHGAEFDARTGKNLKKPRIPFSKAADLRTYPVVIEGESVIVEI